MPNLAQPLQVPTSAAKVDTYVGYAGFQWYPLDSQARDIPFRARTAITPPNTASLQPRAGYTRGNKKNHRSQDPTPGRLQGYYIGLQDNSRAQMHPLIWRDLTLIDKKDSPTNTYQLQLMRNYGFSPYWVNATAPSINEVARFMGGPMHG